MRLCVAFFYYIWHIIEHPHSIAIKRKEEEEEEEGEKTHDKRQIDGRMLVGAHSLSLLPSFIWIHLAILSHIFLSLPRVLSSILASYMRK